MSTLHILENDVWQVGFLPDTGMSTAFGRIRHAAAASSLHATDARGLLRQVLFVRQLSSRPLGQPNRPRDFFASRAVVPASDYLAGRHRHARPSCETIPGRWPMSIAPTWSPPRIRSAMRT